MDFIALEVDFEQLIDNIEHAPPFGNLFWRFVVQCACTETGHDELRGLFQGLTYKNEKLNMKNLKFRALQSYFK